MDHDISIFVPSCEWWLGVTDQFALGGSTAMTRYSERLNVPLITTLSKQKNWIFWAEPLVKQAIQYEKLVVYKLKHVYNILRVIQTNRSRTESTYTASRCVYIWYGQHCHRDHCKHWIDRFISQREIILGRSKQNQTALLRDEVYANQGLTARQGFSNYITYIHSIYRLQNTKSKLIFSNKQTFSVLDFRKQSNFFYFWRYRSPKQMLRCVMPKPAVFPEIAHEDLAKQPSDHTPFNIFAYHFYPFMALTRDSANVHHYQQSIVCNLE